MMEQLAQQRKRFMQASKMSTEESIKNEGEPSGHESKSSGSSSSQAKSSSGKNTQGSEKLGKGSRGNSTGSTEGSQAGSGTATTEYTCCHCLLQTPATESRPIGKNTELLG